MALAWNLPDKPTYPEPEHDEHIGSGSSLHQMVRNGTDAAINSDLTTAITPKPNKTGSMYLKSNRNNIVNQIAGYAENYFQNRPPDSYYFDGMNNNYSKYYYYANEKEKSDHNGNDWVADPYSNSNDAKYMIEKYFNPWLKTSFNRIKSLKSSSKST